jgi:apolipoprotein D and lipocalin family protein
MDEYVEVKNSCIRDGEVAMNEAHAYPVQGSGNSKLKVRYVWPFKSAYWIIALDEGYQYAMVGHPDKKYLWIMSRTPDLDEDVYESLVKRALAKGYDVSRLRRTDQSCGI